MKSTLGAPPAVVAAAWIVLVPATSGTDSVASAQVSQLAVGANASVPTAVPLTVTSAGRVPPVPLAYRKVTVVVPAAVSGTLHRMDAPVWFSVLQNPVPE